jgi:hypothetical protein
MKIGSFLITQSSLGILKMSRRFQILEICQVLMTSGGSLGLLQVFEVDERDLYAIEVDLKPRFVAGLKIHGAEGRQQVDPTGRVAKLNDLIRLVEISLGQPKAPKTELVEGTDDTRGVGGASFDPNVQILGVPGVPVEGNGVTTDDQVTNLIIVE